MRSDTRQKAHRVIYLIESRGVYALEDEELRAALDAFISAMNDEPDAGRFAYLETK